ncbi:glycosyltransferase family 9 protein [uncultured Olleya sp.]|uniref:glycosyltransferase family 9 protein n=1 Tax=uncultured Olleya sp. TaxID=757243 RepID=UPI0025950A71|nr:glycosyltransferase family 9 protein [uncultured Olleya sp.]
MSKTPKHILVIRLSAMGDVAMTVPVLRAFTQRFPDVKLTVLTRPFFAPFFRDLNNVEVFAIDLKKKHKGVLGLYKLSKQLKTLDIDVVADLHNVLRTKILKVFFFGKKFKQIDKGRNQKKALVNGKYFKPLKTTHQRYADVFKALGFTLDLSRPTFSKKQPIPQAVLNLVANQNRKQWIGIAPFAQYASKSYPLDKMKEVVKGLSQDHIVFLFGGKADQKQLNALVINNQVFNIAGQYNLNQELDLISNLDVMVSMDSGNAHLAAMLGVKVVTIWGVTHPYAGFGAFNQPEINNLIPDKTLYPKLPTSIYGNKYPEDYKNIAGTIQSDQIVNRVLAVLKT